MEEYDFECVSPIDNASMDVSKTKRARASNFTSQEEDMLTSLAEKYSNILENKKTNAVTWQQKRDVWEKIAEEFGSQSHSIRTPKHLREKYENMKRKAKTAISVHRNQLYKTGGGPYCSKVTNNEERIASLLGKSATGLLNDFDSDMYKQKNESAIEIDILEDECEVDLNFKSVETEIDDKSNSWSKWNPSKLKKQKSEKLNFKKCAFPDKSDQLLDKQTSFFENEDRRAEERHNFQINELRLKEELLKLEIELKKLEIKKCEQKDNY